MMSGKPTEKTLIARVDTMKVTRWHWQLVMLCMVGIAIENFDMTAIALAMPVIARSWELPPSMIGVLLSGSSLGLLIGASVFGTLSDSIGRKKTFILTTVVYSLFVGLSAFAQDFTQLYIARVLAGIGLGGFIPVASAYISEYAPVKVRGRFMGIFTIGNGIGYCLAVIASMLLVSAMTEGWRWVFAIGAVGFLIIPAVIKLLPESVRWLMGKGRNEEALQVVEQIERRALGQIIVPHEIALLEVKELSKQSSQTSVKRRGGYSRIFSRELLRKSILAAILWFVSGYTFYGFIQWMPTFLTKEMGYTLTAGYTFTLLAAAIGTGTPGIACGFSSDYLGRRLTLTICMLAYAVSGFLFLWFGGWWILPLYWFSSAMTSQLYIYSPELFPTVVRGTGLGFASSIGRVAGFLAPIVIGYLVQDYGLAGVISVNGVLLAIGVLVVWVIGTETKGNVQTQTQSQSF